MALSGFNILNVFFQTAIIKPTCCSKILVFKLRKKDLILFKIGDFFNSRNTLSTNSHLVPEQLTKKKVLQDYLQKSIKYDGIITIGDSSQDMEVIAKGEGLRYLYSHPGYDFRECESDYKIHDLRDVLKEI